MAVTPEGVILKAGVPRESFTEIGETGLSRWGGVIGEEFLSELRGERGRKVVLEMIKNDPVVAAMLRAIAWICRSVEWYAEGDNEKQVEFIEECMDDMSLSWPDFISEALTFLPFGWAYFEIIYKWRKGPNADPLSKYDDGAIGWRKFAIRSQMSLNEWMFDEQGGLQGMKQNKQDGTLVEIPISKALLFRTTVEKGNPEGESVLRPAFRSYYFLKNMQEIEGIGVERDLAGFPVVYLGDGTTKTGSSSDLEAAKAWVRNIRRDEQEGLVIPYPKLSSDGKGVLFELVSTGGRRQFDIDSIISRYEKRMAMCVLAQWLMLGMEQVGSYALSKDQSDFFRQALEAILKIIASTLNRYAIPRLFALNPVLEKLEEELPSIGYSLPIKPDYERFAAAVNALVLAQVLDPTEQGLRDTVRDVLGLPEEAEIEKQLPLPREPVEFTDEDREAARKIIKRAQELKHAGAD